MSERTDVLALFREQKLPARGPLPISDILADWIKLQAKRTQKAYRADIVAFADFVKLDPDRALELLVGCREPVIANTIVLRYQAAMLKRGLADSTINRRLAALRSVLKLARAMGLTTLELAAIKAHKVDERTRDVRGPGLAVIQKIVAVCDADEGAAGYRDGALLRWLWSLGLRRNEIRTVRLADCKLGGDNPRIWIQEKGKREDKRTPVLVAPAVVGQVQPWLEVRGTRPGALFCSFHHGHAGVPAFLDNSAINAILRRRAVQAGYERGRLPPEGPDDQGRPITPHGIRHSSITWVARAQGLVAAQAFARHQNPRTTHRYLDERDRFQVDAQAAIAAEI